MGISPGQVQSREADPFNRAQEGGPGPTRVNGGVGGGSLEKPCQGSKLLDEQDGTGKG